MARRLGILGGMAALIFFIVYRPYNAMDVLLAIGEATTNVLKGIADFFMGAT